MSISVNESRKLFDTCNLPEKKRIHVEKVAQVAEIFVDALLAQKINVNRDLVLVSALLHDIDKNIPRNPGEHHPDTAVRILTERGLFEVAEVVRTHSVHNILSSDPPKSLEQKIVFLSDKMVKYECVGVTERFQLWFEEEDLPIEEKERLKEDLPSVLKLEQELYALARINFSDIKKKCSTDKRVV